MSQAPFGGPQGQNPPYPQPGPPPGPYGPPPNQYGAPQLPNYGPPQQPYQPPPGPGFGWGPNFGPPGPGRPGMPGFQPGWPPQRPRKRSKGPLVAILGLVGVVVVGLWAFGAIKKNADNNYTPPVSSGRYTPEPLPTQEPTDGPTGEPSTSTSTPPEQASESAIVAKNKLYTVGKMPTVNCKEPSVRPTTAKNAQAYWAALKPCLDKAWSPLVTKAGYQFRAPQMLYWSGTSVNSPCGDGPVEVPFYCSSNHMMYMKVDVFVEAYTEYPDAVSKAYARMWYTRSIAHEYGHSVQNETGILDAASKLRYEQPDTAGQTRMTRRLELQANCFAGVFLAANKRSYPINGTMLSVWNKYVVTAGDKPEEGDHGSVASQARFMGKSFSTANTASCNTFAASPANVS